MTLHTIIPLENVLNGYDNEESFRYMELDMNGIRMQVELVNAHQAKIVRLYHAALQDYLNPALAPGQLIELQPAFQSRQ